MHFTAETKELVDTVAYAARAIPARAAHPVLSGMRLTLKDGTLTCEGYDYEQSASASMTVDGSGEGAILLNGRLLADISKALGADTATITVEGETPKAQLVSGRARYSLPLMPLEEYPTIPAGLPDVGSIPASDLATAIRAVTIAAAKDNALPILAATKVDLKPADRILRFTATDRYRLAVKEISYDPVDGAQEQSVIVLASMLDSSQKAFGSAGQVSIQTQPGEKSALFGLAGAERYGTYRVLDGEYPLVEKLLPPSLPAAATMEVSEFKDALTRVALVAERNTPVRVTLTSDTATLAAGNGSSDSDASEEIPCQYTGTDPIVFAFNPGFLQDGLGVISTSHVQIGMSEEGKPVILSPVEDGQVDASYRYLLMPVRTT